MNNSGETVLHVACELLKDAIIVSIIINAKADVNPIRNDDKMPLGLIKEQIEEDPDNFALAEIEEMLEKRGAIVNWRK